MGGPRHNAPEQVVNQEAPRAERIFHRLPECEEKQHVSHQVQHVAVKEEGSEDGDEGKSIPTAEDGADDVVRPHREVSEHHAAAEDVELAIQRKISAFSAISVYVMIGR